MRGKWSQNVGSEIVLNPPLKKIFFSRSLQSILLCIVGELAGGGSVAVAVGVSDM